MSLMVADELEGLGLETCWSSTTLGELEKSGDANIKTGPFGTKLKSHEYTTHGTPLISVREIQVGKIHIEEKTPRVSIAIQERMPEYLLRTGDIVFARKGGIERNAWVPPEQDGFFLGSDGLRLRVSDAIDSQFLAYQMQSHAMQQWLMRHATGATMPSLSGKILSLLPVVLPPLPEQRRIAAVLGALDDKIELNRKMNQTLEAMAQALFKSWFVDFGPVIDNALRAGNPIPGDLQAKATRRSKVMARDSYEIPPYANLFPDSFEDSELGSIPSGWQPTQVCDQARIIHGFAFKGSYFNKEGTGDILVTPGNFLIGGGFKSKKFKFYDGPVPNEYVLNTGDLLVTMTDLSKQADTLGYPAFVPAPRPGKAFLHNQRVGKLTLVPDSVVGRCFLYCLLCTRKYRAGIVGSASGTTVKHTSPTRIGAFSFATPPPHLAARFEELVVDLFHSQRVREVETRMVTQLRDTLLPKLISGEVRVPEAIT